jgi:hypothetical protein
MAACRVGTYPLSFSSGPGSVKGHHAYDIRLCAESRTISSHPRVA